MKPIYILFLQCSFSLALASECQMNKSSIEHGMEVSSNIPWHEINNDLIEFDPGSVLLLTCKYNSYKFKHYCSPRTGQWDVKPGSKSCQGMSKTCPNGPNLEFEILWDWKCSNLWFPGSTCVGTCRTNPLAKKQIFCDPGSHQWIGGEIEADCFPMSCQDDWQTINETSYCFVNTPQTFDDATEFCNSLANGSGKLFEPKDKLTNDLVWEMVSKKEWNWIGIHDRYQENK